MVLGMTQKKNNIGDLVKDLRTSRKVTQEELARLSGVPFATINRIEQNTANPTLATLNKILNVFGYELSGKKISTTNDEIEGKII